MNLTTNAKDAMPTGGKIIIKTNNTELEEEDIRGNPPGKYVRISVQDTGIGMDEETLQNIFDPFFSTKAPGEGTGLGLAIVYGIIEKHGGWIDVRSYPGSGTTFIVCFKAFFEKNGI
jgi:signal transduction histidine kinase